MMHRKARMSTFTNMKQCPVILQEKISWTQDAEIWSSCNSWWKVVKLDAIRLKALHRLNEFEASLYLSSYHVQHIFDLIRDSLGSFFYGSAGLVTWRPSFGAVDGYGSPKYQAAVHNAGNTCSTVRQRCRYSWRLTDVGTIIRIWEGREAIKKTHVQKQHDHARK